MRFYLPNTAPTMLPKPHTPPAPTVLPLPTALAISALLLLGASVSAQQAPAATAAANASAAHPSAGSSTATAVIDAPATHLNAGSDTVTAADKRALRFLDNYLGTWEGDTQLRSLDGQFNNRVQVRMEYSRDPQNPTRLIGRAIFAAGNRIIHANSLTFVEDGQLISVIERDKVRTAYTGTLSADGRSVTWRERESLDALSAYHKETFQNDDGTSTLLVEGYEDYRNQGALLTQKTLFKRITTP